MQRFTEDEAQEILRRAARSPLEGEYTQDDLHRSAAELGISPEAVARAQAEVREERTRREFELYQKAKVRSEATQTLGMIAILAAVNLVTSPHYLWFLWAAPWMLLSLVGTAQKARNRHGESYRRAFRRWQAKNARVHEAELA